MAAPTQQELAYCFKLSYEEVDANVRTAQNIALFNEVKKECYNKSISGNVDKKFNVNSCSCFTGESVSAKDRNEVLSGLFNKYQLKQIKPVMSYEYTNFLDSLFLRTLYDEKLPAKCEMLKKGTFCSEEKLKKLVGQLNIPENETAMDLFTGKIFSKFSNNYDLKNNRQARQKDHPEVFEFARKLMARDYLGFKSRNSQLTSKEFVENYSERVHSLIENFGQGVVVAQLLNHATPEDMPKGFRYSEDKSYYGSAEKLALVMKALTKELVVYKHEGFLTLLSNLDKPDVNKISQAQDFYIDQLVDSDEKINQKCNQVQQFITSTCAESDQRVHAESNLSDLLNVAGVDSSMDIKTAAVLCTDAMAFAKKRKMEELTPEFFAEVFDKNSRYIVDTQLQHNVLGDRLEPDANAVIRVVGSDGATVDSMSEYGTHDSSNTSGSMYDNSTIVGDSRARDYNVGELSEKIFSNIDTSSIGSSSTASSGGFFDAFLGNSGQKTGENTILGSLGDGLKNVKMQDPQQANNFKATNNFNNYLSSTKRAENNEANQSQNTAQENAIFGKSNDMASDARVKELEALEQRTQALIAKLEGQVNSNNSSKEDEGESETPLTAEELEKQKEIDELKKMIAELKTESATLVSESKKDPQSRRPASVPQFIPQQAGFSVSSGSGGSASGQREPSATPASNSVSNIAGNQAPGSIPTSQAQSSNQSSQENNRGTSSNNSSDGVSFQLTGTSGASNSAVSQEAFSSMTNEDFQKFYEQNGDSPLVVKEVRTNSSGVEEEVSVLYEPVVVDGVVTYEKVEKESLEFKENEGPSRSIASITLPESDPKASHADRVDKAITKHQQLIELMEAQLN